MFLAHWRTYIWHRREQTALRTWPQPSPNGWPTRGKHIHHTSAQLKSKYWLSPRTVKRRKENSCWNVRLITFKSQENASFCQQVHKSKSYWCYWNVPALKKHLFLNLISSFAIGSFRWICSPRIWHLFQNQLFNVVLLLLVNPISRGRSFYIIVHFLLLFWVLILLRPSSHVPVWGFCGVWGCPGCRGL